MSDRAATNGTSKTNGTNGAGRTAGADLDALAAAGGPCSVCGTTDARSLTVTHLSTGAAVVVCANHELMHRRSARRAGSVAELRLTFGERRGHRKDRRGAFPVDELGAELTYGFAGERRTGTRRR